LKQSSAVSQAGADGCRNAELSNANKSFADRRVTGDPPCSSPRRRAASTQILESTNNHTPYLIKHRTGFCLLGFISDVVLTASHADQIRAVSGAFGSHGHGRNLTPRRDARAPDPSHAALRTSTSRCDPGQQDAGPSALPKSGWNRWLARTRRGAGPASEPGPRTHRDPSRGRRPRPGGRARRAGPGPRVHRDPSRQ
jgi:hypothetical protein